MLFSIHIPIFINTCTLIKLRIRNLSPVSCSECQWKVFSVWVTNPLGRDLKTDGRTHILKHKTRSLLGGRPLDNKHRRSWHWFPLEQVQMGRNEFPPETITCTKLCRFSTRRITMDFKQLSFLTCFRLKKIFDFLLTDFFFQQNNPAF